MSSEEQEAVGKTAAGCHAATMQTDTATAADSLPTTHNGLEGSQKGRLAATVAAEVVEAAAPTSDAAEATAVNLPFTSGEATSCGHGSREECGHACAQTNTQHTLPGSDNKNQVAGDGRSLQSHHSTPNKAKHSAVADTLGSQKGPCPSNLASSRALNLTKVSHSLCVPWKFWMAEFKWVY